MALTPGGTPYVESSDLVANYPAVSLALAEHIDDLPATVLQIIRATDVTNRTTTSTSFIDASISVTITPQSATSAVLLIYSGRVENYGTGASQAFLGQITDSSNVALSGAESGATGFANLAASGGQKVTNTMLTMIGYVVPGVTTAVTYKVRYSGSTGTTTIYNANNTGQLYAIEVSV